MKISEFFRKINPFLSKTADNLPSLSAPDDNNQDSVKAFDKPLDLFKKSEISKIKAEIDRIEFRQKSIQAVFDYEKKQLEFEKNKTFCEIGKISYELYLKEQIKLDLSSEFPSQLSALQTIDQNINEKTTKSEEFAKHYQEEIQILEANIALQQSNGAEFILAQGLTTPMVLCKKCEQMVAEHAFCSHCGSPLGEEPSVSDSPEAEIKTAVNTEVETPPTEETPCPIPEEVPV